MKTEAVKEIIACRQRELDLFVNDYTGVQICEPSNIIQVFYGIEKLAAEYGIEKLECRTVFKSANKLLKQDYREKSFTIGKVRVIQVID